MKQDTTTKLKRCEASIKRWNARLTRAVNALRKLDRERRRLQAKMGPVNLTDLIGKPMSDKDVGADQQPVKREPVLTVTPAPSDLDIVAQAVKTVKESGLDIPTFLKRSEADVAKMKSERLAKEAADKKKMPLSGRDALQAIRPKRKVKA